MWAGYRHEVIKNFFLGGEYRFQWYDNKYNGEGTLTDPSIVGSDGGIISGISLILFYDTRDNRIWPTRGSYAEIKPFLSNQFIGSDFGYSALELDLRKYLPIGKKGEESVVALAAHAKMVRGDVPFIKLNIVEGAFLLRGLNGIRYRDRDLLAGQVEFRTPLWKIGWFGPLGFTTFLEAGQVSNSFNEIKKEQYVYSVGYGIRYSVVPEERVNLRMDFAYVDGGFGFILELEEAF